MAKVHPGATLTPHFRDFLPPWVARQPWYRGPGAPLRDARRGALITAAQHSVLGTRWIYDGEADPVWLAQLLSLIRANGVSDPSSKRGVGPAEARGRLLAPGGFSDEAVRIDLARVLIPGPAAMASGVAGLVMGSWHPDGGTAGTATGCLALAWPTSQTLCA